MDRRHSIPERRNPDRYDRREDGTDPRLLMPMTYVKSAEELNADMLDVHVVDILGHIEALLRSTREIQRNILRVRGVPPSLTAREREHAATDVQQRVADMLRECDSAREAVHEATGPASRLRDLAQHALK